MPATIVATRGRPTHTPDKLIPDPEVWAMFGVTAMTLHRWTRDPKLGFPPIIKIRTRNYRAAAALEAFKARMAAEGMRAAKKAVRS